ncbi:MAG: 3'-5' exonuclease [Acidobacteriota bacterium]
MSADALKPEAPAETSPAVGAAQEMPPGRWEGEVLVVRREEDIEPALARLEGEPVLGFDTETRPSFRRGVAYPPALIQLACADFAVLFQLGRIGFPEGLKALLADASVLKAGVAVGRDVQDLQAFSYFHPGGFVELGDMAERAGLKSRGLRGLAAEVLGLRIAKGQRTSNWARDVLTASQITYAATDAWIGFALHEALRRLPLPPSPEEGPRPE